MGTVDILDVTVLEPRLKHSTIFQRFDTLKEGDAFVIHNDHDPKPLYYQLLAERGNTFNWTYLEDGPQWWKVMIEKKVEEKETTIGELVAKDFRKAEVFKKYGLDFCCGGKKTLTVACQERGIDVIQIEIELKEVEEQAALPSHDYSQWKLGFLVDYIVNTHHKYVTQAMPSIFEYTQKVAKVHGRRHPEAIEIANIFLKVMDELNRHMMKEENALFPYIKLLVSSDNQKKPLEPSRFGTIQNPIRVMEFEHDEVGSLMSEIKKLSRNYSAPADACTTYRLSYSKLKEFEDDLHQHIHLENNILFPKAVALEAEISKTE